MRTVDHERIAEFVASSSPRPVPEEVVQSLREGSVYPDRVHTRRAHHRGQADYVTESVLRARQLFLRDKLSESAFCLGIAFHYIADATCPGSDDYHHNRWERDISQLPLPRNVSPAFMRTPNDCLRLIGELAQKRTVNSAFYATLALCLGTWNLTWCPIVEKNAWDNALIAQARKAMPDKLGYYLSILLILAGLLLNIGLVWVLGMTILWVLPITLWLTSIPYRNLEHERKSVSWILDWYKEKY